MALVSRWLFVLCVTSCASSPPPGPPPEVSPLLASAGAPLASAPQAAVSEPAWTETSPPTLPGGRFHTPPDCSGAPEGEVELPSESLSSGVGMLSNAAPDPSVDRSYPELGAALQRALPGLRCCYGEAMRAQPGLTGRLVVELQLTPEGKAKSVAQARQKSDITDPMLGSCIENILSKVSFPASRRARPTLVRLPLVFRPRVR
ncbi:MAG: AgmX/PglI C-terminal domain-containing protein [Myxococcales bacterium]|nr:AgmX/PglI C-terminal domain-containing protein [Polyangiaceae bacterium]MDW8251337.1 AgmX/PglI C-terminal domain-containing protein [Myxococcales bacterium]